MKKNLKITTMVVLFIIVLMLSIVGNVYAAEVFSITSISAEGKTDTADVNELTFEGTAINSDIVFHKVGDYVKCKITIKNNEDKDYKIKEITDNNENSFVSYDYSESINTLLEANGSADIFVTIKYANGNGDTANRTQDMNVDITITLEDYNGNTVDETITVNPKTGDQVTVYMIMFGVSFVLLIVFAVLSKKGKNSKKILGLLVAIILVAPIIVSAADNGIVFNFKSKVQLKDKLVLKYLNASEVEETKIVDYGTSTSTLDHEEKENYDFVGWFDENGNEVKTVTDDVKVTPKYEPKEFKITYNLNEGTADTINTYTIESDSFTLIRPKRTGYIFVGWTGTNGDEPQRVVTIEKGSIGDRTYTANWVEYSGPTEVGTYSPSSSQAYMAFGYNSADWKTVGGFWTFPWSSTLPSLAFENEITEVRLGYSSSGYVTYNVQSMAHGSISEDQKRMWFSNDHGSVIDGYWTVGYIENDEEHEIRIKTVSGEIVEFELVY